MKSQASIENLEGLMRTIREEGIARAQKEADALLANAHQQAQALIARAQEQAEAIQKTARSDAEKEMAAGRQALRKAARDLVLELRASLLALLKSLLAESCREQLSGEQLEHFLEAVAVAWVERQGESSLDLWLPEKETKRLLDTFVARLQEKLKVGVDIRPHPGLKAGFHLAQKGDTLHFDFSDRALAEVLAAHLAPRFAALFDEWLKEQKKDEETT